MLNIEKLITVYIGTREEIGRVNETRYRSTSESLLVSHLLAKIPALDCYTCADVVCRSPRIAADHRHALEPQELNKANGAAEMSDGSSVQASPTGNPFPYTAKWPSKAIRT